MKSLAVKAIAGLGVTGIIGTSVSGVWYVNQPKDVKSKLISEGFTLVGSSSRAWRAVFLTHQGNSEFIRFSGVSASNSDKSEGPKVMSACEKAIKVVVGSEDYESSLSKAREYCTVPKIKTVESHILFSDLEPASEDRDWKDSFTLHKSDSSFIDKVNRVNSTNTIKASDTADNSKEKVKEFCNSLKVKAPDSQNISDYEKYCLQTPTTLKSFYEGKGYSLVGVGSWGDKFDAIKSGSDTSVFEDIKGNEAALSASSTKEQGGPKLKVWCETEVSKEINSANPKTKDRCFN